MKILVQQGKVTHPCHMDGPDSKVEALADLVEIHSGVLKRQQKLIYKGKVLLLFQTLSQAKLSDGAKVMLLASSGQTLGQAAAEKLARDKAEVARKKEEQLQLQQQRAAVRQQKRHAWPIADSIQERSAMWEKTGIIALQEAKLKAVPSQVWQHGGACTVVDLGGNQLQSLPPQFAKLRLLQKLQLNHNQLDSSGVNLGLSSALQQLRVLAISNNRLADFPRNLADLTNLRELNISNNRIGSLPDNISNMVSLQQLNAASNALSELPKTLGSCKWLSELEVSQNMLAALPVELSSLQHLQFLRVNNNRLNSIPAELLVNCTALHTIAVHQNPLTIKELRESPEYKEFDVRRRSKYSKQLDMSVMGSSGGFDEGADYIDFKRWKA